MKAIRFGIDPSAQPVPESYVRIPIPQYAAFADVQVDDTIEERGRLRIVELETILDDRQLRQTAMGMALSAHIHRTDLDTDLTEMFEQIYDKLKGGS